MLHFLNKNLYQYLFRENIFCKIFQYFVKMLINILKKYFNIFYLLHHRQAPWPPDDMMVG
jgi:hypothetical protein